MNNRKCALHRRIQELNFAVIELTLYLNTHPCDKEMLAELCEKQRQLAQCKEEFRNYGSLEPCACGERWAWTDDPWPWEFAAN